jgi:hypothetical protein
VHTGAPDAPQPPRVIALVIARLVPNAIAPAAIELMLNPIIAPTSHGGSGGRLGPFGDCLARASMVFPLSGTAAYEPFRGNSFRGAP